MPCVLALEFAAVQLGTLGLFDAASVYVHLGGLPIAMGGARFLSISLSHFLRTRDIHPGKSASWTMRDARTRRERLHQVGLNRRARDVTVAATAAVGRHSTSIALDSGMLFWCHPSDLRVCVCLAAAVI